MKFIVEKKGEKFLVVNDATGVVRGVHPKEGEAKLQAKQLQQTHNNTKEMVSARITPPASVSEE